MEEYNERTFDNSLVLVSYILAIFTLVVGPLIIWAVKKDGEPATAEALRDVANFGLSFAIYNLIAWLTSFILIGLVIGPIVTILMYVFIIIGIVKSLNGEAYKPPFTLDIIK